jgi:PAS domain S-box-containing protein
MPMLACGRADCAILPVAMKTLDPTTLRLAAVVESSSDAIVSQALDGRIETWNPAAERLFGRAASDAIGRPFDAIVHADATVAAERAVTTALSGHLAEPFETIIHRPDQTAVPISVTLSPMLTPDGEVIGLSRIVRDISRQRQLEGEAFRLAAIVDSSEDAIVSKDLNGIVQTWNQAAERLFGYTADDIVGRSITLIIPAERMPEEQAVLTRIRAGQTVDHFETVRQRKDGSLVDISLSVSPIKNAEGVIIGASKIARDITQQRQMALELAEANRAKDEFLATLSHELRTPLNAVLGYTRMLRMEHSREDQRERFIEVIERNGTVLAQLVSDVLDVSSIVTGKIRINPVTCNLTGLLAAAAENVRPSADAKAVTLDVPSSDSEPILVRCDTDRLQQVFWNLLTNAVKFTPRGGRIVARITVDAHDARVTVTDTGVGLTAAALARAFDRFWQADSGSDRQTGGLGLGLSLARHFVELHGGTITGTSDGPGQGATFTVTLPLAERL